MAITPIPGHPGKFYDSTKQRTVTLSTRTRVVNLRQQPYDVYIGRPGRGCGGYFGNPYRVGMECRRCKTIHVHRGGTLECFRAYFEERLKRDPTFRAAVQRLAGKTLGCFCKPKPCHGDIIAEWADKLAEAAVQ